MKAVILAGGRGTRLLPYTTVLPKPLVPVGGLPILEIVLRQLCHQGFSEVVLAVGYLSPLIRAYLDQTSVPSRLRLRYHQETAPLGTAGAVATIDGLDEPFLVMNGDLLTTFPFAAMMHYHAHRGAALTVGVTERKFQVEVGVLGMDADDSVVSYTEKPVQSFQASMGIYAFSPEVRRHMVPGVALDIPGLVVKLLRASDLVAGFRSDAFWLDMGNPADYERASAEFERNRSSFLPDGA